jgi:ferrochelatase
VSRPGVLLVNLGTPDAPTPEAVRRYLAEFLADRRVVDLPWLLWAPILYGVVLRTRPAKSAEAYAQVWTDVGSPLAAITAEQARKLQARLGEVASLVHAMRYGRPSIAAGLKQLRDVGCDRVLIAPLYPQYSGATNASAADKIGEALAAMDWRPELRVLAPYYAEPGYIAALAQDLSAQMAALPFKPEVLLLSFHGLPQRAVRRGDPYYAHCLETSRLLEQAMARPGLRIATSFQSRFGRAKWLEPATDKVLVEEAANGTKRLAVAAPGFSADCLETLEELAIRGREQFLGAGGEQFATLACLNAGEAGMTMLESLVQRELAGWIKDKPTINP